MESTARACSEPRQEGRRVSTQSRTMASAAAAAAMVVVSGPDPKGAKAQQQPFHSTSNGIMSISASGALSSYGTPFAPPLLGKCLARCTDRPLRSHAS